MSTSLHLDLLKDEERFSSNPIRLRVMLPMTALFAAASIALWWGLSSVRVHSQTQLKRELEQEIAGMRPAHNALLALRAQEVNFGAEARQIQFYQHSRLLFGDTLARMAEAVPAAVQLTEMQVPQPPPLAIDPLRPTLGPTNTLETVALRLSGRASGDRPSDAVNTLLVSLRGPAFTNFIRSVEIPKGAFRQDLARTPANRETLLFELSCTCSPRRFE